MGLEQKEKHTSSEERSEKAFEDISSNRNKFHCKENMEETTLSIVNDTLNLRIHDFSTNTEKVTEDHQKQYQHCSVTFSTTVFPDGVDKDTEGFLVVRVRAFVHNAREKTETFSFNWAVSIIDVESNSRFTEYVEKNSNSYSIRSNQESVNEESIPLHIQISAKRPTVRDSTQTRYLKKSFILDRADEFLSNGTLSLKCHIYFDVSAIKYAIYINDAGAFLDTFKNFMRFIPRAVCYKESVKSANPQESFKVFDFTRHVLTLPQFHEVRKRFGVYGIYPKIKMPESEKDIYNILEYVWIFDTRPHRFLLSLDPKEGDVGNLLLNASPVIRRCVKAPMKENREKRVEFPNVDSLTFKIVLHFLGTGDICNCKFYPSVEVYKFSHLFEMHNLQIKCADQIMKRCETKTQLNEIEKIAELYSDDYLFRLLQIYKHRKLEHLDTYVLDDRPDFNFYK